MMNALLFFAVVAQECGAEWEKEWSWQTVPNKLFRTQVWMRIAGNDNGVLVFWACSCYEDMEYAFQEFT